MELSYILSGAAPVIKRYQHGVTNTNVGIPYTVPAAGTAGVVIGTTTGATDLVGMSVEAPGSYLTAQQTDNSDPARTVALIINPDAVWDALMSGGAAENTVLAQQVVTTASTTGLDVTTGTSWTSTEFDEGQVWGFNGANAGKARKITSTSATAATLTVALPADTAVGDVFLRAPYNPMQTVTVQLTTNLYQADASIAVGTGAPFRVIEMVLYGQAQDGDRASRVRFISNSHALNLA